MSLNSNHELFKNREFLGDKLLALVVSDILLEAGMYRPNIEPNLKHFISNKVLAKIAKESGIAIHPHDKTYYFADHQDFDKRLANAFEEKLWLLFIEGNYDQVKAYLKNHIISLIPHVI